MSNACITKKNARWVGHGFPGGFELSGSVVNSASLDDPTTVQGLRARLNGASSLELLSCFVADGPGKHFVRQLARALGVRVFASSNAVGPAHLGGTYFLDFGYCPETGSDVEGYEATPVAGLTTLLPILTVPFTQGYVGQRGNNNQQADAINTFANMGIDQAFFSQKSTGSEFLSAGDLPEYQAEGFQGNDVPGTLTFVINGEAFSVDGYIGWQKKENGKAQSFGFLPKDDLGGSTGGAVQNAGFNPEHSDSNFDPNFTDYIDGGAGSLPTPPKGTGTYEWIIYGKQTYDNKATMPWITNFGLTTIRTEGADTAWQNANFIEEAYIQGSADLKGVLEELNSYLTFSQSLGPQGPVTVDPIATSDQCPTITGDVTLAAGETFKVTVDGEIYIAGTDAALEMSPAYVAGDAGTYSWTLDLGVPPGGGTCVQTLTTGIYDVQATVENPDGFSTSDSTEAEVNILGTGTVTVNDVIVNEASVGGAVFTVNAPAGETLTLAVSNDTATGVSSVTDTTTGSQDFDNNIEVFYGGSWQLYTDVLANHGVIGGSGNTGIPVDSSGALYVRFKLINDDTFEQSEDFDLTATNEDGSAGSNTATGTATILDDGTGSMVTGPDDDPPPTEDTLTPKDNDAPPPTVTGTTVNESSDCGYFTITSASGAPITDLTVIDETTYGLYDNTIKFWDKTGDQWAVFDDATLLDPAVGEEILVCVSISDEQDDLDEPDEAFILKVTEKGGKTAQAATQIWDNDNGDIYEDEPDPTTDQLVPDNSAPKDNDTSYAFSIDSVIINEASQYAIQTVIGPPSTSPTSLAIVDPGNTVIQNFSMEVLNWSTGGWEPFSNQLTDSRGILFVRTDISEEQDSWNDTGEVYTLQVNPTGTVTILDQGDGDIYTGDVQAPDGQTTQYPVIQDYGYETDSGSAPDPNSVGIGQGLDGWCGWIGTQTNLNDGYFQTFESSSGLGTVIIRYYDDGSSEFIT